MLLAWWAKVKQFVRWSMLYEKWTPIKCGGGGGGGEMAVYKK